MLAMCEYCFAGIENFFIPPQFQSRKVRIALLTLHDAPIFMNQLPIMIVIPRAALLFFSMLALISTNTWAYKVERVCEEIAATDKKPARKVCKTLLVRDKPADGKEEKKAGGH